MIASWFQQGSLASSRLNNKSWGVAAVLPPTDAVLILLHARLAPTPRIVRLSDLLAEPFWRYLGLRHRTRYVRSSTMHMQPGCWRAYSTVDQLEQVTTRYTMDEYLGRALRLHS